MIQLNSLKSTLISSALMLFSVSIFAQTPPPTVKKNEKQTELMDPALLIERRNASPVINFPKGKKIDVANVGREPGSYTIKIKFKGLSNVNVFLADNFGDKQYFRDTCFLNAKGEGAFTGNPKLQRGMYMIVFPELNGYFELPITDDQEFTFQADTSYDETKIVVTGSVENEAFAKYQTQRANNSLFRYQLQKQIDAERDEAKRKLLLATKDSFNKVDNAFHDDYMSKYPNHLLTKILKGFQNVKIPENPNPKDSMYEFNYFRNHFWDNIDFTESGLIRAPQGMLIRKLNEFMDRLTFQEPDSLVSSVDMVISKTVPYTETQKYFIQHLTNKYQEKKLMCMDNVTIHMINKYYCDGDAWWYDDTAGRRKMCEEAKRALPTMCGKIAPNLRIADTAGIYKELYKNLGEFTILFFYDPTCGHCKQVIPIVNQVFQKHKKNGIRVYAISTEGKYDEWRKMMRDKPELHEWVNVCKTDLYYPWPYLRYDYNIQANPTIFILDKDARIIGKKLDEHQLEYFIESLLYEKGIIKTKPSLPKEPAADKHNDDHSGSNGNDGGAKAEADKPASSTPKAEH